MNAVLSGQLGLAFLFQGNDVSCISIDDSEAKPVSWAKFSWMFNDANDIQRLKNVAHESVVVALESAWNFDRCMQLLLLVVSDEEKSSIRESSAELVEEFFSDEIIFSKTADRFFAATIPNADEFSTAWMYVDSKPTLAGFLEEVVRHQQEIDIVTKAWDSVSEALFENESAKLETKNTLVREGVFRDLAKSVHNRNAFDVARLKCSNHVRQFLPNSRMVIQEWLDGLAPKREKRVRISDEDSNRVESEPEVSSTLKSFERYRRVRDSKPAVFEKIEKGDVSNAINYARDIIEFQIRNGDSNFAAKTLCDFAQRAKENYRFNLQNEFCKRAIEICPTDGWAHGQLADSFVCLGRFNEAKAAFEKCIEFGEGGFGSTGIARLYARSGDLLKALESFESAKNEYPEEASAWFGKAEVYRNLYRYNEALNEYSAAISEFGNERIGHCGYAAVLTDLGKFDHARAKYDEVVSLFGDDAVALAGKADTYAKEGFLAKAISAYDYVIERFPNQPVPVAGRANVRRLQGDVDQAIAEYKDAIERFDSDPSFFTGLAEVYRTSGDLAKAEIMYSSAIEKFPFDPMSWAGKANILKLQGRFEDSLQLYDQTVAKFPSQFVALSGRANLLKNLGHADDAIVAYNRLQELTGNESAISVSIAAVESSRGRFTQALKLLGEMPRFAKTQDDWIANHVYGMVLLRKGKTKEAIHLFKIGIEKCPWEKEKRYFRSALAIAQLKNHDFEKVTKLISQPESPLDYIILLCANAELGNSDQLGEFEVSLHRDCPPAYLKVRDQAINKYIYQKDMTSINDFVDGLCAAALTA